LRVAGQCWDLHALTCVLRAVTRMRQAATVTACGSAVQETALKRRRLIRLTLSLRVGRERGADASRMEV